MKTKSLLVLAGIGAPLILSSAASADILIVEKDITGNEGFVSKVFNLYFVFDGSDSATNFLTAGAGLPGGQEANISVRDGFFYQNELGGRTAPNHGFLPIIPGLAVDTFVTMGAKSFGAGGDVVVDATQLSPGFPTEDGVQQPGGIWTTTRLQVDDGAWFVTPDDLQGHVGNAANLANAVLMGQFSVAAGAGPNAGIFGQILIQGVNNGQAFQSLFSFDNQVPAPGALALLGTAGLLGCRRRRRR